ncbi:hypothetical protein PHISP_03329 [Aspergillus sp. HF37]|nr:hypothetical protein PHISP_03329 [Aspergillus sp. HF37]
MCSIFQTLPSSLLERHLPEQINRVWAGRHLSIASPLWQSFSPAEDDANPEALPGREGLESLLNSSDPAISEWAKKKRDAFNQLRYSSDPQLRGYYQEHINRSSRKGNLESQRVAGVNLQGYLLGKEAQVKGYSTTTSQLVHCIQCGMFSFTISKDFGLHLAKGQSVFVQFHLAESAHAQKYALKALPSDPASRLAVSISGQDSNGEFHAYLVNKSGRRTAMKIDTLVDIPEGVTFEGRSKRPRRWLKTMVRGKSTDMYTTPN